MNFTSLLAYEEPPGMPDFILIPGILIGLGLVIWWFGWRREHDDGSPKIKWFALIPMAIAAFLAWEKFRMSIDTGIDGQVFRESIENSRRLIYAGYFAFLAPTIFIVAAVIWYLVDKKMSKYR